MTRAIPLNQVKRYTHTYNKILGKFNKIKDKIKEKIR